MKICRSCVPFLVFLSVAVPTFAITVSSPGNGATVGTTFSLSASASSCSSQAVSAMGYSFDNSANNTIANGTSLSTEASTSTGAHVLHVKAWGNQGASCVSDVSINVSAASGSAGISVSSPGNGAQVSLPFSVSASAGTCSSQAVSAMGFSMDNSAANTIVNGTSINTSVTSAATGSHTLHLKAWGNQGSSCVADVSITVGAPSSSGASVQSITVSSPGNGASVSSPFQLSASASSCSSQAVSALGYSLDSSASTTTSNGTSINTQISAASGPHTLHVKAWGNGGSSCVADIAINVTGGSANSVIPSNAVGVSSIQSMGNWKTAFDTGTGSGSATGSTGVTGSPSESGHARVFATTFDNYGGERYDVSFGDDNTSMNFFYDTWVYLDSSASQIANLEMDMNQTMQNGQTAIFGFQCDGWTSTWDYTANKGTPQNPVDTWVHSSQACNVHKWGINQWHHVQVLYSRDNSGNITYKTVWLDGSQQNINATVNSAFALGWAPTLLTNVQVDELVPGWSSANVYMDNLTVYRW